MKKVLVISTLVATAMLNTNPAHADASTEENVGVASGAMVGAAVGGPVGFIIGSAIGAVFGNQVAEANELETKLAEAKQKEAQLTEEVAMIQENLRLETANSLDAQWVTEGLTLNVMFTTNSSQLSDADLANVKRISQILAQFPELRLRLDGYSDPRGTKEHNMVLSQKRVDSVITAFESHGIDQERLLGSAHGELDGFNNQTDMDAYAMARKVSVNFVTNNSSLAQN